MNNETVNAIVAMCQEGRSTKEHWSQRDLELAIVHLTMVGTIPTEVQQQDTPVRIRVCCEKCGTLHIDEGKWATEPHKRHQCKNCGLVWQPALFPTVGVQFLNEEQ